MYFVLEKNTTCIFFSTIPFSPSISTTNKQFNPYAVISIHIKVTHLVLSPCRKEITRSFKPGASKFAVFQGEKWKIKEKERKRDV